MGFLSNRSSRVAVTCMMALLLFSADAFPATYTNEKRQELQMLLGFGAGYGGDIVGRVEVAGDQIDSYVAGKGMYVYVGDYINLEGTDWSILGRGGYRKGNILTLSKGSKFSAWPLDMGMSYSGREFRLNGGLTRHFSAKYTESPDPRLLLSPAGNVAYVRDGDYDDSNGLFFEYAWEIERDTSYILIRYTNIEYEMDMVSQGLNHKYKDSVDGSSISIGMEIGLY